MKQLLHGLIVMSLTVGGMTRIVGNDLVLAQTAPPLQIQTLKGQLFAIQGEVYVLREAAGRFVRVRVD